MPNERSDWNECYRTGELPWDSGLSSRELRNILEQFPIPRGRALELGCGTGTNAVWLAENGFVVTAVDVAPLALEQGRQKAAAAGVTVDFVEADVERFGADLQPFDFVFDRGCYHCCRRTDVSGYLETLQTVSKPGTWIVVLCGNVGETSDSGIPRVSEQEIRTELGRDFEIVQLREFHFEDAGGAQGPLGWSVVLRHDSPLS